MATTALTLHPLENFNNYVGFNLAINGQIRHNIIAKLKLFPLYGKHNYRKFKFNIQPPHTTSCTSCNGTIHVHVRLVTIFNMR